MSMRMNASQEAKARQAGGSSFQSDLYLNYKLSHQFPIDALLQVKENLNTFPHTAYWTHWFKRKDISEANLAILNVLWFEGYTEAYEKYMFEVMTPETKETHDWKRRNMRGSRMR